MSETAWNLSIYTFIGKDTGTFTENVQQNECDTQGDAHFSRVEHTTLKGKEGS